MPTNEIVLSVRDIYRHGEALKAIKSPNLITMKEKRILRETVISLVACNPFRLSLVLEKKEKTI